MGVSGGVLPESRSRRIRLLQRSRQRHHISFDRFDRKHLPVREIARILFRIERGIVQGKTLPALSVFERERQVPFFCGSRQLRKSSRDRIDFERKDLNAFGIVTDQPEAKPAVFLGGNFEFAGQTVGFRGIDLHRRAGSAKSLPFDGFAFRGFDQLAAEPFVFLVEIPDHPEGTVKRLQGEFLIRRLHRHGNGNQLIVPVAVRLDVGFHGDQNIAARVFADRDDPAAHEVVRLEFGRFRVALGRRNGDEGIKGGDFLAVHENAEDRAVVSVPRILGLEVPEKDGKGVFSGVHLDREMSGSVILSEEFDGAETFGNHARRSDRRSVGTRGGRFERGQAKRQGSFDLRRIGLAVVHIKIGESCVMGERKGNFIGASGKRRQFEQHAVRRFDIFFCENLVGKRGDADARLGRILVFAEESVILFGIEPENALIVLERPGGKPEFGFDLVRSENASVKGLSLRIEETLIPVRVEIGIDTVFAAVHAADALRIVPFREIREQVLFYEHFRAFQKMSLEGPVFRHDVGRGQRGLSGETESARRVRDRGTGVGEQRTIRIQAADPLTVSEKIGIDRMLMENAVLLEAVIAPEPGIIERKFRSESDSGRSVFGRHRDLRLNLLEFAHGRNGAFPGAESVHGSVAGVADAARGVLIVRIGLRGRVPFLHHPGVILAPFLRKGIAVEETSRGHILELVLARGRVIDRPDEFLIDGRGGVRHRSSLVISDGVLAGKEDVREVVAFPHGRLVVGAIGVHISHGLEPGFVQARHAFDVSFARRPVGQFRVEGGSAGIPDLEHHAGRIDALCRRRQRLVIRDGHVDIDDRLDFIRPFHGVAYGQFVLETFAVPVPVWSRGGLPVSLKHIQLQFGREEFRVVLKRHQSQVFHGNGNGFAASAEEEVKRADGRIFHPEGEGNPLLLKDHQGSFGKRSSAEGHQPRRSLPVIFHAPEVRENELGVIGNVGQGERDSEQTFCRVHTGGAYGQRSVRRFAEFKAELRVFQRFRTVGKSFPYRQDLRAVLPYGEFRLGIRTEVIQERRVEVKLLVQGRFAPRHVQLAEIRSVDQNPETGRNAGIGKLRIAPDDSPRKVAELDDDAVAHRRGEPFCLHGELVFTDIQLQGGESGDKKGKEAGKAVLHGKNSLFFSIFRCRRC